MMNIYFARQADLGKNDEIVASAANEANGSIVCTSVALFRFCGRFIRKCRYKALTCFGTQGFKNPLKETGNKCKKGRQASFYCIE